MDAYICNGLRTPIGRYGGALSSVRTDDLAAAVIRKVVADANEQIADVIDDVALGCANQAGEDNRNVARMAALLAELPETVPGVTLNRLCGSGLDAVGYATRAIWSNEAHIFVAGGVESMSRAPFVVAKFERPFERAFNAFDTTIGWRFINPKMQELYGTESMPETAENVASACAISRMDQDNFAVRSQSRAFQARKSGRFAEEILPVKFKDTRGDEFTVTDDEHIRETTIENLSRLRPIVHSEGTVTAGNASGINDGAAAMIVASEAAVGQFGLKPVARILGLAVAGVSPRTMGLGPVPATNKLLAQLGMSIRQFDVIELNEAFAAQAIAVLRELGVAEDADHVNPNGGAIALGHPLGMSGARLAITCALELQKRQRKLGLCTMCIGVGQGIAMAIERV